MNHEEADEERLAEEQLAAAIRSVNLPRPSLAVEGTTRQRIARRALRRKILYGAAAGCILLAVGVTIRLGQWSQPEVAREAVMLSDSELASLFAPPPVDPLVILERRQQVAWRTIEQWEANR